MLKSERTKLHIIETVAPIFNKNGFSAMSLAKITEATGLTKGAIYSHFKNKEELACEAFRYSVRKVLNDLNTYVSSGKTPMEMLLNVAKFYEHYYEYIQKFGGCPILNIGVDADHQQNSISNLVKSYNERIIKQFIKLIDNAKKSNEIKNAINSEFYAKRFFYMIEGAVYMSHVMKDPYYLKDVAQHITTIIHHQMQ